MWILLIEGRKISIMAIKSLADVTPLMNIWKLTKLFLFLFYLSYLSGPWHLKVTANIATYRRTTQALYRLA